LRPEKVKRIVDWGAAVSTFAAADLFRDPVLIPRQPGVYFFRDRTGYLYIGEADNLRLRVAKHLDHSDRKALARYLWDHGVADLAVELHAFAPTSDGGRKGHRRVYESEMIASRNPRFNIQP
jgi:excinuclease UvrABC nuclease subunit